MNRAVRPLSICRASDVVVLTVIIRLARIPNVDDRSRRSNYGAKGSLRRQKSFV